MSLEELTGKAKETVGKVLGDAKTEAEGKTEAIGANLKDKAEDVLNVAKDLAEKAGDVLNESKEKLSESTKGVVEGVKNLLNKNEE